MNSSIKTHDGIRPSSEQAKTRIDELLEVNSSDNLLPKGLATLLNKATESSQHRLKLAKILIRSFSIIPIKSDGSKAPQCLWKPYQNKKADIDELTAWWSNISTCGIAVIGGAVSGNLLILDFEDFDIFCKWLSRGVWFGYGDILKRCAIVLTPRTTGGVHLYLRLSFEPPGCEKLAMRLTPNKKLATLIETKASGGYVLFPGSPAKCHENNQTYELIYGNPFNLPIIDKNDFDDLLSLARLFDEEEKNQKSPPSQEQVGNANSNIDVDFETVFKELKRLPSPPDKKLVSDALSYINADNYDDWVTIGMALKVSGLPDKIAFQLWDDWSKTSPSQYAKNAPGEMLRKWGSF